MEVDAAQEDEDGQMEEEEESEDGQMIESTETELAGTFEGWNPKFTPRMTINKDGTLDLSFQGKGGSKSWTCTKEPFTYTMGTPNRIAIVGLAMSDNCISKNLQQNNMALVGIWHFNVGGNYISMNLKQGFLYFPVIMSLAGALPFPKFNFPMELEGQGEEVANHDGDMEHMVGDVVDASQQLTEIQKQDEQDNVDASHVSSLSREYIGKNHKFIARVIIHRGRTLDMSIEGTRPGVRSWHCKNERFEYTEGTPNRIRIPGLRNRNNCIRKNLEQSRFKLRSIWHWSIGNYLSVNVRHHCCLYYSMALRKK